MNKMSEILEYITGTLIAEEFFYIELFDGYTAESELEQTIIDRLKKIDLDDCKTDLQKFADALKSVQDLLDVAMPNDVKIQLFELVIELNKSASNYENALLYAKEYEESGLNKKRATHILAEINLKINTQESLLSAIDYADQLNAVDFNYSPLKIKCDALCALNRHGEAIAALDFCLGYDKDYWLLLVRKFEVLLKMQETKKAFDCVKKKKISSAALSCYFYHAFDNSDAAIAVAKGYIKQHPGEKLVYGILAEICENIDEKIYYYTLVNDINSARTLMHLYDKRANPSDAKQYLKVAKKLLQKTKGQSRGFVEPFLYSPYVNFDRNFTKKLLKKFEQDRQLGGCDLSLIGKAYECGLGVEKNLETAFAYYTKSMNLEDKVCDCGTFFHANCLYYGFGTAQNTEQAKLEILSIIDRRVEADRYCMYAVFALEGDSRFPKEKAKEYLLSQDHYPACNLLLYRLTKGTDEAAEHLKNFKETAEKDKYLMRQVYAPYIENPDAEYVHFITN